MRIFACLCFSWNEDDGSWKHEQTTIASRFPVPCGHYINVNISRIRKKKVDYVMRFTLCSLFAYVVFWCFLLLSASNCALFAVVFFMCFPRYVIQSNKPLIRKNGETLYEILIRLHVVINRFSRLWRPVFLCVYYFHKSKGWLLQNESGRNMWNTIFTEQRSAK